MTLNKLELFPVETLLSDYEASLEILREQYRVTVEMFERAVTGAKDRAARGRIDPHAAHNLGNRVVELARITAEIERTEQLRDHVKSLIGK